MYQVFVGEFLPMIYVYKPEAMILLELFELKKNDGIHSFELSKLQF